MSKVVEYLRPDIPRILINRNIVKVPKVSNNKDDYLFHACLLGDCGKSNESLDVSLVHIIGNWFSLISFYSSRFTRLDVVVEALAQKMKGDDVVILSPTGGAIGLVTSTRQCRTNQKKAFFFSAVDGFKFWQGQYSTRASCTLWRMPKWNQRMGILLQKLLWLWSLQCLLSSLLVITRTWKAWVCSGEVIEE